MFLPPGIMCVRTNSVPFCSSQHLNKIPDISPEELDDSFGWVIFEPALGYKKNTNQPHSVTGAKQPTQFGGCARQASDPVLVLVKKWRGPRG